MPALSNYTCKFFRPQNVSRLIKLAALVLVSVFCSPLFAKTCPQVFAEAGAIPSTDRAANFQCQLTASTAGFDMETYYCGGGDWIERYCGSPSPKNLGKSNLNICNPCNVGTGNKFQPETDYEAVGVSPLVLERAYNSSPAALGSENWGVQWQAVYWQRLKLINDNLIVALRPDGKALYFNLVSGVWTADADTNERLTETVTGWQLITNEQATELYGDGGLLLSITDRIGRQQILTYSDGTTGSNGGFILDASGNATASPLPSGLMILVRDDTGRSLRFGYDSKMRVVTMTNPAGGNYLYAYDESGSLVSVTYPDARKRTYVYNEPSNTAGASLPGALTGIVDENDERFSTYQYDVSGRVASSEHAGGAQKVMLGYTTTSLGSISSTSVTDSFNTLRNYSFTTIADAVRNTAILQPARVGSTAASSVMVYDANGNISSLTDFNGNTTSYTHDLARNLETSRTEAVGTPQARTITTIWHPTYRLPTQIDEPGKRTDYTYDAGGNLLSKTVTDTALNKSRTWAYTYNNLGQVLTEDGPRTDMPDITTYTYYTETSAGNYTMGDLATVTNALGYVASITKYDANGRPLSITDPNGVVTTLTYSPRGWLTSRTVNGAQVTTYEYDGVGQLIKVTQPDGSYLNYIYDAAHRLTDIADASGNKIHYTLDAMGNRTKEDIVDPSSALKKTQSRVYDALNRLQQEIGGSNPAAQITQYTYDNNGNLTSTTDPLSRVTSNGYDALDRLVQITDPASGVVRQGYDALDQQISVTDPRNVLTTYNKNALGDVTQTVSPDSGTTQRVHDAAGNIVQTTDARGIVANYSYDALNRLTAISYPANTAENVSFTYDSTANGNKGIGRLTGYNNDGGATVLVYDAYGNVAQQTDSIGTRIYTTAYQYDSANRVSEITYPSGRIVYYSRNTLGQIAQVQTRNDGGSSLVTLVSAAAYEPFGPLNSLTFGNGVTTSLQHDADYRVARISTTAIPLWDFVYSYDLASNLLAQADQASTYSRNFSYDALYRVITDVNNTGSWSYAYDATGNRTKRINTSTQNLTYATTSNRLTKVGSTTQARDAAGNLITFGTKTYTYNNANRLNTYAASGAVRAQMQYNALGQRVAKLQIAKPLHMHYDRVGRYLGTTAFNTDGSMYQRYEWIYLDDLPVAQVRTNYNASTGAVSSRRRLYIHGDHLNTPRTMTDSARTMVWRWDGDAFGQTKPNQNPDGNSTSEILNLRFSGQYADSETGLFYNYFRDYDPSTGRYLQSDPIGLAGGLNTYAYVEGNPIKYVDPLGLRCTFVQSTGRMTCINENGQQYYDERGYSGHGDGRNNPDRQGEPNVGPVPTGAWRWGNTYNSPNTGRNTVVLEPLEGNSCHDTARNCGSFRAHGNNATNNASRGCIILPSNRTMIPRGEVVDVVP